MSDKLLPCPFCGQTPDVNGPHTFQDSQGTKWGAVVCCCTGPEVRTGYGPVEEWKADAIEAWNRRASPSSPVDAGAVEAETKGPYEARICKDIPADCCDYGVISLSEGREVCRVWREQDARAIAAALAALASLPAAPSGQAPLAEVKPLDWIKVAKSSGKHGIRYRTNAALEEFLSDILPPATGAAEAGWQTIETCPCVKDACYWGYRNGSHYEFWAGEHKGERRFYLDEPDGYYRVYPTHWRPLPAAPREGR